MFLYLGSEHAAMKGAVELPDSVSPQARQTDMRTCKKKRNSQSDSMQSN